MSEGRKPKLTWEEMGESGIWRSKAGEIEVRVADLDGLIVMHYTGQVMRNLKSKTIDAAKLEAEQVLYNRCNFYLPAARALGMLEPTKEER